MNVAIDREFIAQVLVALVATAGGWLMFVEPKATELNRLEATISANTAVTNTASMSVVDMASEASRVRARIAEIQAQNNFAMNSSDLYARIDQLADELGVIVQTMRPGSEAEAKANASVHTARIDLSIEGPYENAAAFLDAVSSMSGFVRPVSLTVAPMDRNGNKLVAARYVCELLQFNVPDALTAFTESPDEF